MSAKRQDRLTRDIVVNTAMNMAARDGLTKLSMRNLAKELGFEVMSLYTHVRNKADLHTGMVECCIQELAMPALEQSTSWRAALRKHALDLRALFERHPWLVELWLGSEPGRRRFDLMEWELSAFAASGMAERKAHTAYHAFVNHTVGFMLQRRAMIFADGEATVDTMIAIVDPDQHDNVLRHIKQHREGQSGGDAFIYTLDLLLDSFD